MYTEKARTSWDAWTWTGLTRLDPATGKWYFWTLSEDCVQDAVSTVSCTYLEISNMKRFALVAAVLAVSACAGEKKEEAAPAAAAPAAAAMDTSMKMDSTKKDTTKMAAPAAAPAAAAPAAKKP